MAQPLDYTVILRDGIRYEIELKDKNIIENYSSNHSKRNMLEIWTNHRYILINLDMVVAIEMNKKVRKNYDRRTIRGKWHNFVSKFKNND